ncbi:UDP-2,4-diacetamido-2,4,6-trideoxy-beta-L-altropyranose hydrolase [Paraburkholderia sp. GAS334]|uniref:UDP-2,4-diacetamido-2,4, 6-trideoxy-beta-L-altropyranose hydrolase n=1 Tax=Paraburkholderia sp. GAS334 TaxID=3035131 RepID=UPI003D23655A
MRRVLFRCDSGAATGMGHLMRSLALARQFAARGAAIAFVCRDLPGALLTLPEQTGYALHVLAGDDDDAEADAEETREFARRWQADLVVVDHYGLDARWEVALRQTVGRLLAIDDLADRPHACDWLLDQNDCSPSAQRYERWVPEACQLLLGPRFALVQPEFRAARTRCAPRDGQLRRVVMFFSGSDEGNETAKALQGLATLENTGWEVDVVIGAAHPDPSGIEVACQSLGWGFHQQTPYMADLLSVADLSVGSAGSASWERCLLGVPALVVELADNQREVIAALTERGCARSLGKARDVTADTYAEGLRALDADALRSMSRAAWGCVDGRGAARVVDAVNETMDRCA